MDPVRIGLVVVLLPGALALVLGLAGRRHGVAGVAAHAVGALVAIAVLLGVTWWPISVPDRFGHIIALGAFGALVASQLGSRARWPLQIGVGLLAALAIIKPLLEHRFAGAKGIAAIAIFTAAVVLIARSVERIGKQDDRLAMVPLLLALACASLAAGITGSVTLAQLGGAVTAALGGVWVLTLRSNRGWLTGMALSLAVALTSVVALGYLYSSLGLLPALLLAAVPVASAAALVVLPTRRALAGAFAAAVVLVAIALVPLFAAGEATTSDPADDDYGYGYD